MKCPKCKHENRDMAKFCDNCGEKLQLACSKCGSELRPQAKFCDNCGNRIVDTTTIAEIVIPKLEDMHTQLQSLIPEALAQKYLSAEQMATGENRPVTALFADISGFTPLSATKSSETIFQMVQDCFKKLVSIVAKYEGSISGFRGDGLLALFGAPILHENDAERAILSAIDMREAMKYYQLQVSIGINTAMMTVGEIQTQLHSEYTAYGTDIILAQRLQASAEPNQILVGSGTHRLTRRAFDFDIIPSLTVQGFSQPVTAYSVKQVKVHPEKLRGIEGLRARMIGREHEFADVKEAVDEWLSGHGQIVSIIGEAGIGKSRLVFEMRNHINRTQHAVSLLEGRCVSIGQPISYWPFIDILKTYFQLSEGDDTPTIARKVTDSINQLMPQSADETLPLLGQLLSIKFGNELDDRLKFATPEQIRHQTLMRLRDIFTTLARQKPLLLILEDLHWSDDLSLDLISLLMDELANTPLMLLCVYRPEKEHRVWQLGDQARRKCMDRFTEIMLKPLSSRESRELIESLLEIDNLPESTKSMIMVKSEGNPFFIEEVIRSLIEQGIVYQDNDRWIAKNDIAEIDVPDTIQSVILSRVDRLQSEAKYVLQCASVIGRLFKHRLLDHLTQHERELNRYISEFEDRDLVYQERMIPELEYAFKHALTQEATYQSILERKRKEFHFQVAQGIERLYQERLDEYYEELAGHYTKSNDVAKALEYLVKSGDKAKRNYINNIAISYFQKVLNMIERSGFENKELQLKAYQELGEIYLGIGDIPEAEEAFGEALTIATHMKLPPRRLARQYYWLAETIVETHPRFDEYMQYGMMGMEILGHDKECLEAVLMNSIIGYSSARKSYYNNEEEFERHIRRNMDVIDKIEYSPELSSPYITISLFLLNYESPESGFEWAKKLAKRANHSGDLAGEISALIWIADNLRYMGDYQNSLEAHEKGIRIAERIGYKSGLYQFHFYMGEIYIFLGDLKKSKNHLRKSLELSEYIDRKWSIAISNHRLGIIAMANHQWDEAVYYFEQFVKNGYDIWLRYLYLGKALLDKGDIDSALKHLKSVAEKAINHRYYAKLLYQLFLLMEEIYIKLGKPDEFKNFCNALRQNNPKKINEKRLNQLYLTSSSVSDQFTNIAYKDDFNNIDSSWIWVDQFRDSNYIIKDNSGLEIHSANGRDINHHRFDAPHFTRDISGDFALEVCLSSVSEEKPQIGGLFVWRDRTNHLHFDKGVNGKDEVGLYGILNREEQFIGRGLLPPSDNNGTYLRVERLGDEFTSYCSVDGENWFTCGKITLPMEDPIQVGVHAIGMIDRTIYCGEYKEGTATLFRNFKIWKR